MVRMAIETRRARDRLRHIRKVERRQPLNTIVPGLLHSATLCLPFAVNRLTDGFGRLVIPLSEIYEEFMVEIAEE